MSGRVEYKFLVPNSLLDPIRAALVPYMRPDPFGERPDKNEYTVRSIYYDTAQYSCYLEKLDGLELRRKFRIRGYGEPDEGSLVFLEIKRKRGSAIGKHRAPLRHVDLASFLASPNIERDVLANKRSQARDDARRFLYYYYRMGLRPTVLVVYDREPFFGRFDSSLRMTFDKNLRGQVSPRLSDLYRDAGLSLAMAQHFIFEVKFFRGALPAWAIQLVRRFGLQRMALSKYTICMDDAKTYRAPRDRGVASVASA